MKIFKRIAALLLKNRKQGGNADIIKYHTLLNPAAGGYKEARKYSVEKLSEVLFILFAGLLIFVALTLSSVLEGSLEAENYRIKRKGYGEGDRRVELTASLREGTLKEDMEITVGEREYSGAETDRIFSEAGKIIEERMLGENSSPERVEYDLNLMDSIEEYPVTIDWSVDDYSLIDSNGVIQEDVRDKEGTPAVLTATLEYRGRYEEYQYPVMVYPRHMEAGGKIRDLILRKIEKYDSLTVSEENLILPDRVGDTPVSFTRTRGREGVLVLLITLIAMAAVWFGRDRDLEKEVKLREREMLRDYPDIVSRLSLFFSAGMTIRGAFEKTASDYEIRKNSKKTGKRYAFEEMLIAVREMKGGVPEAQAYQNFGLRSGVRRYSKLGTLLSQNLQKGNAGLKEALETESRDAFEDRKAEARRVGEEAGTKLLLPMGIMLSVVMIIVVLPAFMSFSL